MPYPADRGTLSNEDYLLAMLSAAIRQFSGQSGELRISRDEMLAAVEDPMRLRITKSYDETRKELVLNVAPNFSHAQVFTAKTSWQHERAVAAQLIPEPMDDVIPVLRTRASSGSDLAPENQSLEGVRTTMSDSQQAEMERRANRQNDPMLRARQERASRARAQASLALENLQQVQAEDAEALRQSGKTE